MSYDETLVSGAVYELRAPTDNSVIGLAERNVARVAGEQLPLTYCSLPLDPVAVMKVSSECDKIQFAVSGDGRPLLIGWPKGDGDCLVVRLTP